MRFPAAVNLTDMDFMNNRTNLPLLLLLAASVTCLAAADQSAAVPRATCNFNPGWKLLVGDPTNAAAAEFDDSSWKPITLPHAWNEDAAFKVAIADLPTGVAWYRKRFVLPDNAAGRKVFLEFEGIRQGGEFYLNGKFIGRHENGVMAFGFDVTDFVRPAPEENVLAARIDNDWDYREKATGTAFQWANTNFNANYGGIPKNVKLHLTGKLYQTLPLYSRLGTLGVYVYAQDFDIPGRSATITAESEVRNEFAEPRTFTYEVAIEDMKANVVKTFAAGPVTLAAGATTTVKASAPVAGLDFWSWGYGCLYTVQTALKVDGREVDVVRTRTGFRKTEFGGGLIRLNDRVIQVKGYAQRTSNEWPALGPAVPPWLSDFSNRLIVEGNGNLIRWMHVAPWKQDVESCDRVGLIQAMPAADAEADVQGRQWEQRVEVMRDAIIYNRNNPSILFYESGNKGVTEDHMREMKALRDRYDPHGGRAAGCREMLNSQVAEYGGEMLYINKSARLPFWAMEYCRDEGLRKYWDEFSPPFHKNGEGPPYRNGPAGEYNRNQDSFALEDVARWFDYWRERPGTGTRVSSGGVNIIFSDSNTHFRGAENYRRSGEVDAMRIPKDAFWAHQVMWDGWVDVERPRAHIVGHWNYVPGTRKNVYVVSSAEKVELFLNGQSLGFGCQSNRFQFTFKNVAWQPGTLHALGFDGKGRKICEAEKQTAGPATAIQMNALTGPGGLKADGADVALVEFEVVDARGRRCPTNMNRVHFELTGPAEWRGGLAQGPDNYILSKSLPAECGVNRVLIRSTTEPGQMTLTAKSEGLAPATVTFVSTPVPVANGLSLDLPVEGLPSYLGRGPAPQSPAFRVSRVAVPIAGATAGANTNAVMAAVDDDETTAWTNDNRLATGWITFQFAREAVPAEVVMKLRGWRERSYPLCISVDGQEVFRGATPRSLGYVTLPLRPVPGRTMKIELTHGPEVREGFNITELENHRTPRSGSVNGTNGALGIVEFECYEAPSVSPTERDFGIQSLR
jgi:beta-galactosidase